ncbi:DUF3179 domain-containing protein [Marinobacter daqiaonensis]|uniref:DUF3179 domain-containing protein n=1 Tax=Marinobacter daqiaonensis TaxID=650891 RepID=UPI001432A51F|nr:DUF3179 domain-containing protein [Marinobacter daqiaonensis]
MRDTIGGQVVSVHYDAGVPNAWVTDSMGEELAATRAFWFAWYTFYPETTIFQVTDE